MYLEVKKQHTIPVGNDMYNLKNIVNRAWEIKKENYNNIFSECLKMAWKEAKTTNNGIYIKTWFLDKNFNSNERLIISTAEMGGELECIKETEKAYQFCADSDYGSFIFWCPKSCTMSSHEARIEMTKRVQKINIDLIKGENVIVIK